LTKLGFSKRDLQMLELIERYILEDQWCELVATKMRIQPTTVRGKLYGLRLKFQKAVDFIEAYKKWRASLFKKSGGKWRHL